MPYIKKEDRARLSVALNGLCEEIGKGCTCGELNYLITMLCLEYIEHKGLSYTNINEIIGVLECAKSEFYRRVAIPYEEKKREENSDVF